MNPSCLPLSAFPLYLLAEAGVSSEAIDGAHLEGGALSISEAHRRLFWWSKKTLSSFARPSRPNQRRLFSMFEHFERTLHPGPPSFERPAIPGPSVDAVLLSIIAHIQTVDFLLDDDCRRRPSLSSQRCPVEPRRCCSRRQTGERPRRHPPVLPT